MAERTLSPDRSGLLQVLAAAGWEELTFSRRFLLRLRSLPWLWLPRSALPSLFLVGLGAGLAAVVVVFALLVYAAGGTDEIRREIEWWRIEHRTHHDPGPNAPYEWFARHARRHGRRRA